MEELRNILRRYSGNEYLIDSTIKKIKSCMETRDSDSPICFDKIFKSIGIGAYKFAFEPISGVIVKFCSELNDTEEELTLYNKAKEYGVDFAFAPTSFYKLPIPIFNSFYSNDQDSEYSNILYDYIEIQPKVDIIITKSDMCAKDFENYLHEKNISFDQYEYTNCFIINSWDWIEVFVDVNGLEKLQKFVDFCNIYCVTDLHNRNIGFWNGKSVVIDWLSDTESTPEVTSEI